MSISVDDLVASLSSNHIGQEQLDLATLHAQLAQTLFAQPPNTVQSASHREYAQPSNTPLARTPSSSVCWEAGDFARGRSSSVASMSQRHGADDHRRDLEDMDEDERMVEDLLFCSPPASAGATTTSFSFTHQRMLSSSPQNHSDIHSRMHGSSSRSCTFDHGQYELPPANTSMFATTDPFFMAQLQAAQTPSVFAQAGRPSQHSPFLAHQSQYAYSHHPLSSEVDSPAFFAAPAQAFKC
ncbi:hypothetical protein B0H21DRAFT_21290 [Amylocystis lapponica]|nr:hypothetical protein B0H21DRAFT_21290 [Amylocystis lapponica]